MLTETFRSFVFRWPSAIPALALVILAALAPSLVRELLLTGALAMVTLNGMHIERTQLAAIKA